MAGNYETLFARMALTLGVAEREALRDALNEHGKAGWGVPFAKFLVERGVLSSADAARVTDELERYVAKKKDGGAKSSTGEAPTKPSSTEAPRAPSKRLKAQEASPTPGPTSPPATPPPSADADRAKQWALFDRATKDPLEKLVGRRVGKASLEKLVETGDVATVFAGRFGDDERPVQVKILRPDRVRDKVALERFTREAQVLAKIDHPNIGRVLEAGVAEGLKVQVGGAQAKLRFMVIEASGGSTLAALLARSGALSPERAVKIARATALGLAAAHRAKIVHRDVRPANVLVADDGGVRLLGFGIAKDTAVPGRLTATGQITGHPTYMAPEAAQAGDVDGKADVYSLGCVLYTALAARPPFQSQSVVKLVGLHLNTPATPIRQVAPHVAPRLAALVDRLLSKSPLERPDADELARLLGAKDLLDGGAEPPKPLKADSEEELRRALATEESSGEGAALPSGPVCAACELPLDASGPAGTIHESPLCAKCLERVEALDLCASCFQELGDKERGADSAVFGGRVYCAGCTGRVKLACAACGQDVPLAGLLAGSAKAKGAQLVHATCPPKKA